MLLKFSVENFCSFRDKVILDLEAGEVSFGHTSSLIHPYPNIKVIPVVSIFGANASGKSNILRAINVMAKEVCGSFKVGGVVRSSYESFNPFMFDYGYRGKASVFGVTLCLDGGSI
jgi:uncharacterized protein